jgi:thiol-disulfide isomerase/thioredoxin
MREPVWIQMAALLAVLVFTAAVQPAAAALTIGDPPPKLQVGKWIQGDPVTEFKPGTVYIIEFWATWCGPCRDSIPHLNELYQQFKDRNLVVIGQDVWESDEGGVEPFVKKMGDRMTYRVALDDKNGGKKGAMAVNWMDAADQHGIPTAFVVNQEGKIAWIGHPMALDRTLLDRILMGQYDLAKAAVEHEKSQEVARRQMELYRKLNTGLKNHDWDAAETAVTALEQARPEAERYGFGIMRLKILLGQKDYAGAIKLGTSLMDAKPNEAMFLNGLAWTIVIQPGLDNRELLALAERLADRANTAAHGKVPAILDTLARARFLNGKTEDAIALEQQAVDLSTDDSEKQLLKRCLESYQQGKLPSVAH